MWKCNRLLENDKVNEKIWQLKTKMPSSTVHFNYNLHIFTARWCNKTKRVSYTPRCILVRENMKNTRVTSSRGLLNHPRVALMWDLPRRTLHFSITSSVRSHVSTFYRVNLIYCTDSMVQHGFCFALPRNKSGFNGAFQFCEEQITMFLSIFYLHTDYYYLFKSSADFVCCFSFVTCISQPNPIHKSPLAEKHRDTSRLVKRIQRTHRQTFSVYLYRARLFWEFIFLFCRMELLGTGRPIHCLSPQGRSW